MKAPVLEYKNISHWRSQIFTRLLSVVAVLATILALPSIAMALREGLTSVAIMDTVGLAWIIALWQFDRLPYTFRVYSFLAVMYMIGIGLMLTVGPVSLIFLLAPAVMAAVLLGPLHSHVALAAGALSVVLLGVTGHAKLYVTGQPDYALLPTLLITLNFLCVGILITIPCNTLLRRLASSIENLQQFAATLARGKDELQRANVDLRLHSAAVAQLNDMVLIVDAAERPGARLPVIFANAAFQRRTGYRADEVIGSSMRMLHGADTDRAEVERILDSVARAEPVNAELIHYTKAGEPFWVELEMVPVTDEGGAHTHWVAVGRDISERKKSAKAIHRLAFYDVLTGLPNRRMLMERLEQLLAQSQAGGSMGAVMFIDLDNFKFINDARGHAVGDAVLRAAAERLEQLMRKDDAVARLGGDEFVVMLAHLGQDAEETMRSALLVADKIRHAFAHGFTIEDHSYSATASIGISLLPKPGQTAQDLLREADTAMYRAKSEGRNSVVFFEANMQAEMERRLTMERDLGAAMDNGELSMHLQLQVDSAGAPTGAELLMRWTRSNGKMVPPDVFIPVAETTGLIAPLGQWALRQACMAWLELDAAGHALPLSVNVSPSQFRQPDFVTQVRAVLADTGAPASQLIFEVTEGLFIEELDKTVARMNELAAMGIRFSIDDFGTGYSNLGYLKRMPLYELKIDKSFIRDTPHDPNGVAIVQSVLAMAAHLGLRVVAEGVETSEQAAFLSTHHAPQMQGYLFGRPAPLPGFIAALRERAAVAV